MVHHWAAPLSDPPAWIELTWDSPKRIRQVQITFDSGFQRQLTLTSQDSQNRTLLRAAQPETVRDYKLVCVRPDGSRETIAAVRGNFQRVNRHTLTPIEAKSLRIEVEATNGLDEARIFEVRCYA